MKNVLIIIPLFVILFYGIEFIKTFASGSVGSYYSSFFSGDIIFYPVLIRSICLCFVYFVVFLFAYTYKNYRQGIRIASWVFFIALIVPTIEVVNGTDYYEDIVYKAIVFFGGILLAITFGISSARKALDKREKSQLTYSEGIIDHFEEHFVGFLIIVLSPLLERLA